MTYFGSNNAGPVNILNGESIFNKNNNFWAGNIDISATASDTSTVCKDIKDTKDPTTGATYNVPNNPEITVKQSQNRKLIFYYLNAPALDVLQGFGNLGAFSKKDATAPDLVYGQNTDTAACQDVAVVLAGNQVRWYRLRDNETNAAYLAPSETHDPTCHVRDVNLFEGKFLTIAGGIVVPENKLNMGIVPPDDAATMAIINKVALDVSFATGGGLTHVDCEWSTFNPLTWIFCPLFDAFQGIMSNIDTMIERELKLNTSYFDTDNNTGKAFHNAWNAFYNMSLIVLVLIGLIMVFSQAFSVGPFDAYTIRKVMPRIIIAVIGIVLSWSIMQYLVDLSNIAGNSMRAMIYFPFQSLKNPVFSAGVLSVALLGGSAAIGTVGLLGMLAVFGAGAIALMVGVATIIFREALVMVLVVLSPIAIVFSILPNTQRIWKMWSSNFIRALVAFPIITGMIAVGSAMSRVFTAGDQSAFHQIAAFASVYAPFFMLPAAFRLAGGAIGSFNGVVKNKAASCGSRIE